MGLMSDVARETQRGLSLNAQRHVDQALASLAAGQWAVFSLDQICELGMSPSAVRARASTGRLHRVYRSVYAVVPADLLTRDGRFMAAVLACGPDAALSHRSAAALLGLRASERAKFDVTLPGRARRSHAGIDIHCSTTLTAADIKRERNIPCTTVSRTLLDLADVIAPRAVERALDQAEILDALDLRKLRDQLERNAARPAARRLRTILEDVYTGRTPTWNDFEDAFFVLCRSHGIRQPDVNVFVDPGDGEPMIRVDFLWRAERVVVETDGRETHRTLQAFERDRRNDQRLSAAGWRPIRATWRQLKREPDRVAKTIVTLLSR
jgi:predicted transcriptional regulator of viral defense system